MPAMIPHTDVFNALYEELRASRQAVRQQGGSIDYQNRPDYFFTVAESSRRATSML